MGKTAIVIGGTGGIGRNIVGALEMRQMRVAVVSRGKHLPINDGIAHTLVSNFKGDTTDEAGVNKLLEVIRAECGKLDYVVYAAGLPPDIDVPLLEYSLAAWERTFDTYVKGFLIFFRSALPHMNKDAHFIVLGSAITRFSSDSLPPISAGHYAAAKAALVELVKWTRRESHDHGVLLSLISPSAVDTAIHQTDGALSKIPKRLLPVTVVTDAVISFLLNGIEGNLELVA